MLKSKRSQHEIVGFILIIIIVAIAGVIFLSLSISKGEKIEKTSVEISDFLQSSMHYTTECANRHIPDYKSMQELIKDCYRNQRCLDEKMSCDVMGETMSKMLDESFHFSENGKNKAYKINIYYKDINEEEPDESFLILEKGLFGNCSSEIGANHAIPIDTGNINVDMELCKGKL